jgi:hypothetical protein
MIIKGDQPSLLDAVRTALAGPEAASSYRRGPGEHRARAPGAAQHPHRPRHWHRLAARRADHADPPRYRPTRGPWTHKEIAYGITSLPIPGQARHLAHHTRAH